MFDDRTSAGTRLAGELEERGIDVDVVTAVPRGGLPVGRAVADRLDVPLDVTVAQKIQAPGAPDRALGAVAADGSSWRNDREIQRLGIPEAQLERQRTETLDRVRQRLDRYQEVLSTSRSNEGTVLVVDDGIETGATAIAAIRQLRRHGADRVELATPVAPEPCLDRLLDETECDGTVALERPSEETPTRHYYRRFKQVTDDEAVELLDPK